MFVFHTQDGHRDYPSAARVDAVQSALPLVRSRAGAISPCGAACDRAARKLESISWVIGSRLSERRAMSGASF